MFRKHRRNSAKRTVRRRVRPFFFQPGSERLEDKVLLTCVGMNPLFYDDFDDGNLDTNESEGWSTASFGGAGFETQSAFRFDGTATGDWNLFEISSRDTFDVWNDSGATFEFRSGNATVTGDSLDLDGADLQTQFGIVSTNEPRSGSGGGPDQNEVNLFQNTGGGLFVPLQYHAQGDPRDLIVNGSVQLANKFKRPWASDDSEIGVHIPATFQINGYDGQTELVTSISLDKSGWSVAFNYDIEVQPLSNGIEVTANEVRGGWSAESLSDAEITDEFVGGVYPFAMGQNMGVGRGAVDLAEVSVCEGSRTQYPADELEPNNRQLEPYDLGTGDQSIDRLSIHNRNDEDWFRWTATEDGMLNVSLLADSEGGDVDLELYSAEGQWLDVSARFDSFEGIQRQVRANDTYLFRVKGFQDSAHPSYKITTSNAPLTGESIYVAVGDEVRVFNANGEHVSTFRDPVLDSGVTGDVEIGPEGSIYVSVDVGGNAGEDGKIVQFSPSGVRLGVYAVPDDPFTRSARYPFGFDVLDDGTFLVAQPNSGKVVRVNYQGKTLETIDVSPAVPSDVAVKSTGQLVIADDERGESMLNSVVGDRFWLAERGSDKTTLRDGSGSAIRTHPGVRPIDAEENQGGTLYVTELTNVAPFSQGTLRAFDRNGDSLFAVPISGLPLGLAVSTGHQLSRPPTPLVDSDSDGLPDAWETQGLDVNFDGVIDLDLPSMGADARHKDLFVEIDAMVDRAPLAGAIRRVQDAFSVVPHSFVNNPDGKNGINLHVVIDETSIPLDDFTLPGDPTANQVEANAWMEFDAIKGARFGSPAERASANWNQIRRARQSVFRYGLFADNYAKSQSSGLAEIPGNDFLVTLGGSSTPGGTEDEQAATFMHEFGHTLGLKHGGGDHINYKPNYHSVMNYHWQFPNTLGNVGWSLDYSRDVAPTLNENQLDESVGIGFPTGSTHDTANHRVFIGGGPPLTHGVVSEVGPVNFSQSDNDSDGNPNNDRGVSRDLNGGFDQNSNGRLDSWETSAGETLIGHNDWTQLTYGITNHHHFADGVHQNAPLVELHLAQLQNHGITLDIPTMFVGSYTKVPLSIRPESGLRVEDLEFVISDGPAGGEISRSLDADDNPASPTVMLLAGYEVGAHTLEVRAKTSGQTLASFGYSIVDTLASATDGPSHWISSQFAFPPKGQTLASAPNRPENQAAHPARGTRNVAIVLVDTADRRFNSQQVADIKELWAAETVDGVPADGKLASVAHYYRELSQNQLDVKADVYGPVHLPGKWTDYFKVGSRAEAKNNFYAGCASAADNLIDYRNVDSVVCVSQSINAMPRNYAWPTARSVAIKVNDCTAGNKCDLPMEFVSMPADWSMIQRRSEVEQVVNAGGDSLFGTHPNGSPFSWAADSTANPSSAQNGSAAGSGVFSTTAAIDLTHPSVPPGTPMSLFQSERWDADAGQEMRWDFPVPAGWHDVSLYFAEIYDGSKSIGARVFDVSIEGHRVLDDYDVFADVGGNKGVVKTFTVRSDGNLDIDFDRVVSNPAIKAIEVRQTGRHIRSTLAHEIGHNLGMGDIYKWDGHTAHVQSLAPGGWDLMANENPLPHTLLPHRMRLGWVPDRELKLINLNASASAIDETVTLHPVERGQAPAGQYSGIEIRLIDGWNYYCEYRVGQSQHIGDQRLPTDNRVVCTDVAFDPNFDHPSRRKPIMLLRKDSDGDGPVLGNGQDYRETQPGTNNQLRISVLGLDGNQANIRVEYHSANGLAPATAGPDPSIRPWNPSTWQSPDIEVLNQKNQTDPKFKNVPWENHKNTLVARVSNTGTVNANQVRVEFWVRDYTLGGNPEIFVGDDIKDVAVGQTVEFQTEWVPAKEGHYCIIAKIVPYQTPGPSPTNEITDANNIAQSNYTQFISKTASPASREGTFVQVGNPYDQPTRAFLYVAEQSSPLYRTYLEHTWIDLAPREVRDVKVQVEYAYEQPPIDPYLEQFISQPNDVLLYATILPPGADAEAVPLPLGGASIRVLTGRATRIEDFQVGDNNVAYGNVVTVDTGDAVTDGVVLVVVQDDQGNDAAYLHAVPDANGFFQADLEMTWHSIVAYYLPADGFGESDSGRPLRNPDLGPLRGNVNGDNVVDSRDIDSLFAAVAAGATDPSYDLNDDQQVNQKDVDYLVETILQTQVGDANLDLTFDSSDLVLIFQRGEYEDQLTKNSTWATGDWNGDGEFDSGDLVAAFQKGGYSAVAKRPG